MTEYTILLVFSLSVVVTSHAFIPSLKGKKTTGKIHVMRSREISLKSNMWHFQSFLLDWSAQSAHLERYILLKMHLNWTSGSKVMSNWRILKTIKNKRNLFLFLAISHNQWPPTSNWFRQIATYLWPDQVEWVKCWHWSTISFRYAT